MEHSEFSVFKALRGEYGAAFPIMRHCLKHGDYSASGYSKGDISGAVGMCPACLKEKASEEAAEAKREARIARIAASRIPERFANSTIDNYFPEEGTREALEIVTAYVKRWPEQRRTGEGLLLLGDVGTGKTHLAIALLMGALDRTGMRGRYCTASELLREIRATWKGYGERSEQQMVDYFGSVDLLVLDEVGATNGSDNERVILFDVLNERYERMLPTIVCGNVSLQELETALDRRSVDRLRENGGRAVVMKGKSYRARKSA